MLNININKLEIKFDKKKLVNISFYIDDSTALIGESGSGKSLTLKALLNLLPSNLTVKKEIDSSFELNYNSIGFIPQNPFTSLSSMTKVGDQFFCSLEKKEEVLALVDLDKNILKKFPSALRVDEPQGSHSLVRLDLGGAILLSRVTRRSAVELQLVEGMPLYAQVKSVALIS